MAVTTKNNAKTPGGSGWLAWAFVPVLSGIAFLYIGNRAKQGKWTVWGIVYMMVPLLLGALFWNAAALSGLFFVKVGVTLLCYVAGIVHAFVARPAYLALMAGGAPDAPVAETPPELKSEEPAQNAALRSDVPIEEMDLSALSTEELIEMALAASSSKKTERSAPPPNSASEEPVREEEPPIAPPPVATKIHVPAAPHNSSGLVDLNRATAQELVQRLGLSERDAKKAVSVCAALGGFASLQQFGEALGFRPHVIERLRPHVTLSPRRSPK